MGIFEEHKITKDMGVRTPTGIMTLKYGSVNVEPGHLLTPLQVKSQPEVKWDTDDGALYTLIMNDPDAIRREGHHWMVVNIPGCDISKGEVRTEYVGSRPRKGTGLHRYVFLVYKQPSKINIEEAKLSKHSREGRHSHKAQAVADKYKLEGPVACNFYQAEYDDYVPELHKL